MPERRRLGEQLRLDVLAGHEELDRFDSGPRRSRDQIFPLRREETGREPVLASSKELPDEPELLVVPGPDQAALEASPASSAALARSATAANACGSLTAMSASDLRL